MSVNQLVEIAASAARTATENFDTAVENLDFTGIIVIIVSTAHASTPSVVFTLQGYDEESATWYDILASAAVTGEATTKLTIGPGVSAVANVSTGHVLPRRWRVRAVAGDSDSITYSIGGELTRG
jgi:hypothetical protein